MKLHLSLFASLPLLLVSNPKISLPRLMSRSLPPYLLLQEFYDFRSYVQIFHLLWVNFCVWYKIVIQFCSFACSGSDFSIPFIKETTLSLLYQCILGLFAIISWSYICEFVSGLSVLCHWSKCLFLCKYHTLLITVAL